MLNLCLNSNESQHTYAYRRDAYKKKCVILRYDLTTGKINMIWSRKLSGKDAKT